MNERSREALVERMAEAIWDAQSGGVLWVAATEPSREFCRAGARAALAVVEAEQGESVTAELDEIRSDLLGAAEQLDLTARNYESDPNERTSAAYQHSAAWFMDVAVPRFERSIRADERNKQTESEPQSVAEARAVVLKAIKVQDGDWGWPKQIVDALIAAVRAEKHE